MRLSIDVSLRYFVLGLYLDRDLHILRMYPLPFVRMTLDWSAEK